MSKSMKIIFALVLVVVIAIGAGVVMSGNKTNETVDNTSGGDQEASVMIAYSSSGFSPASVTVKSGDSIKITNGTEAKIEPSSAPHPVHTDNPELNVGDIEAGESKTFTVNTKGTWKYHNHYKSSDTGTIIVE